MNTLGLIVGNRGFFPDHLCATGREAVIKVLKEQGLEVVALPTDATKFGAVESLDDARKCADLFRANADKLDGVLVTLPNFGDERAVANTLRWANLDVPVLVHAFDDMPGTMTIKDRRDAFCGKMSACNNLRQYNIPYSLTKLHTVDPTRPEFAADVRRFAATCRVVKKFKNARVGAIGARPGAFNTVRYSEKILEHYGITTETLDLSEILGWIKNLPDDDPAVKAKMAAIKSYTNTANVPEGPLVKMAKLGVVIEKWSNEQKLIGTAIQCWTSLEEFYGVVPCTIMSMSSNKLDPQRVRDRHYRADRHVGPHGRGGKTGRAAGLEQQLRHRPEHGRGVSLLEFAERFFQQSEDGLPGNHRRHGGQGKHVRHDRRQNRSGAVHVLPRFDRRHDRQSSHLRGRRHVYRRQAEHASAVTAHSASIVCKSLLQFICKNGFRTPCGGDEDCRSATRCTMR